MAAACLAGSGLMVAGLTVLLWRRVINAGRYAQATGGLALGWLIAAILHYAGGVHAG